VAARQGIATLLAIVSGLLAVAAAACWALSHGIVDEQAFGDRAVAALDRDAVQRAISAEIYAEVQPHVPASAASPAQVRAIVDRAVGGASFQRVFREGAITINRALFHSDGTDATLRINLAQVLRPSSPQLAQVVGDRDVTVISLHAGRVLGRTSRAADVVSTLALVLPFFAAAALIGALLLGGRRALAGAGVAVAAGGALLLAGLLVARAHVDDAVALTGAPVALARDAARGIGDSYAADLRTIAIVALVAGLLIAAVGLWPRRLSR
jgi:hypothetical protein